MKTTGTVFIAAAWAVAFAAGRWSGRVVGRTEEAPERQAGDKGVPAFLSTEEWPAPLEAAWFRNPEGTDPLGDLEAQVEAAEETEDARWPTPKHDNSSDVAMAGWNVLSTHFREFGKALEAKAGETEDADGIRADWTLAERLFSEIDGRPTVGFGGSAQGAFNVEEKSRIAWHFLQARLHENAASVAWVAVKDAGGTWMGESFSLTNGFCVASWPLERETVDYGERVETDEPQLWYVFADPESAARNDEDGTFAVEVSFVPAEPCGQASDAGLRERFRLKGGVLAPADAWRAFEERQFRRNAELWREEGADDIPVLAAGRVSARLHDSFEKECQAAVEALKAVAPSDARRAELDEEFAFARSLAREIAGDSSAIAGSPSGGRVADRQVVEQAMDPFLRNWLEAVDHLEDWEAIRSVRGTFRGESFTATSGVVVLGAPDWIRGNAESADIRLENGGVCHRLLRLAPERVEYADQDLVVGFDILDPWVMDSSSQPGSGKFLLRDGRAIEDGTW